MATATYLVFGDLHGRILPAFRLAQVWQREHGERLAGLLQVGDLGFFPDSSRLDKATKNHAQRDPLELGTQLVALPSREANQVFADPETPAALWFTAGNHEDYTALAELSHGVNAGDSDFPVDAYNRVRCIRDGHVTVLPDGIRVGALWGIDDQARLARRKTMQQARIRSRSANQLAASVLDVLLTHESPLDAMYPDSGSEMISLIIHLARPAFAFFGHYHCVGRLDQCDFGSTEVYHLHGLEMRGHASCAEERSVGVLRWGEAQKRFEYLEPKWLATFTRHNWKYR
jgi:Calcineurin-like phosphoesterase